MGGRGEEEERVVNKSELGIPVVCLSACRKVSKVLDELAVR